MSKELIINEKQKVSDGLAPEILKKLLEKFTTMDEWSEESLRGAVDTMMKEHGWKMGQILWPLRAALTGRAFSPGAYEVAALLGKEKTLERLKKAATSF